MTTSDWLGLIAGPSFTVVSSWIGGVAGVFYLLEFAGVWRWLLGKIRGRRPRAAPRFFIPRVLSLIGIGASVGLAFKPSLWAEIVLAVVVVAIGLVFGVLDWRRSRREPAAERAVVSPQVATAPALPEPVMWQPGDQLAMRDVYNRMRVERAADREASDRNRRSLLKEGYRLLGRLEANPIGIAAAVGVHRDVRTWARDARGYVRAERAHLQPNLPDDEPLNTGDPQQLIGLVDVYLRLLRNEPPGT